MLVRNNSAKVKIKTQQTNWKSSMISILQERNQKSWQKLLFLYNWVVTSLKWVWFTNYWLQIFTSFMRRRFMWDQCRAVWFTLWFLSNLIFGTFLNIKLLFQKTCWFPSSKKVSICYRHNSFKPLRTLKGWSAGEEGGGGEFFMYVSSREKEKPWIF